MTVSSKSGEELRLALSSEAALTALLRTRGWEPDPQPAPMNPKAALAGARIFHAPGKDAPRLLVVYRADMTERAVYGNELRRLQGEANRLVSVLESNGAGDRAPALCVVASGTFLVLFALDGNPFARRQRYTPDRLKPGSPLETSWHHLSAAALAAKARVAPAGDVLGDILGSAGRREWDLQGLVAGGKLDEEFVSYMSYARRRIATLLLDTKKGRARLREIWPNLKDALQAEDAPDRMPELEVLVREGRWRRAIIATIDTVLLRLVLYRYLEAQFGYQPTASEQHRIALGSYDELLDRTTRYDGDKLDKLLKRIRDDKGLGDVKEQGDLFQPFTLIDGETFRAGLRQRAEHYQGSAGGDLHNGFIAAAADKVQEFLVENHGEELALLLEETRTDRFSFHYADLDPRAFGEFYQSTIGTDVRAVYDRDAGTVTVGVVDFARNQKEHGSYYTEEKLSGWLIERTLGKTWAEWKARLVASVGRKGVKPAEIRSLLAELCAWRIIDPTVGSGVFLRGAFEFLSRRRDEVGSLLADSLTPKTLAAVTEGAPHNLFRLHGDDEAGDWEWHVLLHMLYGIDVDVKAVNVASNLLTLSALSYKRHGVCFPSFINTSLKRGNALVPLLHPKDRPDFAAKFAKELRALMTLRRGLRDPNLTRSQWDTLHRKAADLTRYVRHVYIVTRFETVFPGLHKRDLIARVEQVGCFFYELEFPEAFFSDDGLLRADAGFNVVLGNPPWEEPAAELKQFLPEFDGGFLALSGKAAEKREKELLSDPEIKQRWGDFERSIDDYKALLTSGWYEHQRRQIRGKFPGAHSNLYKYATEVSWKILAPEGRAGLVLDGGLWGDFASSGLRALLLDESRTEAVCGFINTDEIFPGIHNWMKFGANVFRKGGRTETLHAVFIREKLDDLDRFDRLAIAMSADEIRTDRRDSYPVPEVRNETHYRVERTLTRFPSLNDPPWSVNTYSRELNAGEQREYFFPAARVGYFPLIQGEQFNHWGVHQGELPALWVDPSDAGAGGFLQAKQRGRVLGAIADFLEETKGKLKGGKGKAALAWVKALTGQKDLPAEWLRLDWDGYRLAWRDITNAMNERTLLAGILPPRVAVSHTAPFVRPFAIQVSAAGVSWRLQYELPVLLYLSGMLSSFVCDAVARTKVPKTHLSSETFQAIPVPPWADTPTQRRISELAGRLTCLPTTRSRPWADYTALAASIGLSPAKDGLVDTAARREAEVELNAHVASLYGIGREDFRFLMDLLFMTPEHRDAHASLRDDIGGRIPASRPVDASGPIAHKTRTDIGRTPREVATNTPPVSELTRLKKTFAAHGPLVPGKLVGLPRAPRETFAFVPADPKLTLENAFQLWEGEPFALTHYEVPGENALQLQRGANDALKRLAEQGYRVELGTDPEERRQKAREGARLFSDVIDGARTFEVIRSRPVARPRGGKTILTLEGHSFLKAPQKEFGLISIDPSDLVLEHEHVQLSPGELPVEVRKALDDYLGDLRPADVLDVERIRSLAALVGTGTPEVARVAPAMMRPALDPNLAPPAHLTPEVAAALKRLAPARDKMTAALLTQKNTGWCLPWEEWCSSNTEAAGKALQSLRASGDQLVILPLATKSDEVVANAGDFAHPVVFSMSDLHFGRGVANDLADAVTPAIEAAYVRAIEDWRVFASKHRKETKTRQPAYLILNGDILDFWSADVRPSRTGNLQEPAATLVRTAQGPRMEITALDARERMDAILSAHAPFFTAVHEWVDSDPLNFLVYVGGNHDDHVNRFGLGAELAIRLHGSRAVFAGDCVFFPQLATFFEHGHRGDEFNQPHPGMGFLASLGELMVSLFVNPVGRGGTSALALAVAQLKGTANATGFNITAVQDLVARYAKLTDARNVSQSNYDLWMATIDTLTQEEAVGAIADNARDVLTKANPSGKDAASALSGTIDGLLKLWMTAEFQDLTVKLASYAVGAPLAVQGFLRSLARKEPRVRLGFQDSDGYRGDHALRIHVVGHTHEPDNTFPPLGTAGNVLAQHLNTGTGTDAYEVHGRGWLRKIWPLFSIGNLNAARKSQAALIRTTPASGTSIVEVSGVPYRGLQNNDPVKVATANDIVIPLDFVGAPRNRVKLGP